MLKRGILIAQLIMLAPSLAHAVGSKHEYLSTHPSNVMRSLPTVHRWCEQQAVNISRRVRKDPSITVTRGSLDVRLRPFRPFKPEVTVLALPETGTVLISVTATNFVFYAVAQDGKLVKTSLASI